MSCVLNHSTTIRKPIIWLPFIAAVALKPLCVLSEDYYPPNGGFSFYCSFAYMHMSGLKTRVLVRGKATWRLTRFSDSMFTAVNGFGKKHVFRCGQEMTNFEDYLLAKGYEPLERGRATATLVRK